MAAAGNTGRQRSKNYTNKSNEKLNHCVYSCHSQTFDFIPTCLKLLENVLIFLVFHVKTQLLFTQCLGACIATQQEINMSAKYVSFDQLRRQLE
jgi:hypothetical protein